MTKATARSGNTRMIFLGEASLTDGFRLIGFETYTDPTAEQVDKLVRELISVRQNAFLVIDQRLADAGIPAIERVRKEGGHIVVTAVPPLNSPESFHMMIDDRLRIMFAGTGSDTQA